MVRSCMNINITDLYSATLFQQMAWESEMSLNKFLHVVISPGGSVSEPHTSELIVEFSYIHIHTHNIYLAYVVPSVI